MTVATKNDELDYLRNQLRQCLRADSPRSSSTLADMQTRNAQGEQKLKKAKGPHVTYATPTTPAGRSKPNITEQDYSHSKYVKLIWDLDPLYNRNIIARYSPSQRLRVDATVIFSSAVASEFVGYETRPRARKMVRWLILHPWSSGRMYEAFGLSREEWRTSRHRRLLYDVKARLSQIDAESLKAWAAACEGLKDNA